MDAPDLVFRARSGLSGVYHLVRDGVVVYVGQSQNVMQRLAAHPIAYDEARAYLCDPADLNERERADIERFRPVLNRAGVTSPYTGAARPTRAIRVHGELYRSRSTFFRTHRLIRKGDLRAAGVIRAADDLDALAIHGFPAPVAIRAGCPIWDGEQVAAWVEANLNEQVPA